MSTRASSPPNLARFSHRHGSNNDFSKPRDTKKSVIVRCHSNGASLSPYTGATSSISDPGERLRPAQGST
eukprot:7622024-Pyramimonas_sp.AAC.1